MMVRWSGEYGKSEEEAVKYPFYFDFLSIQQGKHAMAGLCHTPIFLSYERRKKKE